MNRRHPGDHIEVEFRIGQIPYLLAPVNVVRDLDTCLALHLSPAIQYLERVLMDGSPVPRVIPLGTLHRLGSRLEVREWHDGHWLVVSRPDCPHDTRLKWGVTFTEFRGWYVNLQEPWHRTARGFTTQDHYLDIVVSPDLSWTWKDEDELKEAIGIGRLTPVEAEGIRREGERIIADIEARRWPFDGSLIDWRPDPSWSIPQLPDGWDEGLGERFVPGW